MIEITSTQFIQNPSHFQNIAQKEPVLVADGDQKQVLMNYDEYKQLADHQAEKPFENAYERYLRVMPKFSEEELALLADDTVVFDMSEMN